MMSDVTLMRDFKETHNCDVTLMRDMSDVTLMRDFKETRNDGAHKLRPVRIVPHPHC